MAGGPPCQGFSRTQSVAKFGTYCLRHNGILVRYGVAGMTEGATAAASVHDTAAFILKVHGPVSAMKLEKLVYYCQAWSLVWDERPMFSERIEAWANGPVCPDLY